MELAYYWLADVPSTSLQMITHHGTSTIADYLKYFDELVSSYLEDDQEMIGGPGIIVEIDESKFGKRKYHRGHQVDGAWVFGGVERTETRRRFAVMVEERNAVTLLGAIRNRIHPESIIYSDMWRGYCRIEDELGMEHHTVNHSVEFVSQDGVHTNTIEGVWNGFKIRIPPRYRTESSLGTKLTVRIWRRENASNLWEGFLKCLRETAY